MLEFAVVDRPDIHKLNRNGKKTAMRLALRETATTGQAIKVVGCSLGKRRSFSSNWAVTMRADGFRLVSRYDATTRTLFAWAVKRNNDVPA